MAVRNVSDNAVASFESQEDWFDWIQGAKSSELKSIRTLTLHLTDIDLSVMLNAPRDAAKRESGPSAWDLYQRELVQLDKGLAALPSLSHIRIIPPRPNQSQLLRGMYLSFLKLIPKRHRQLRRLELADSPEVLKVVPELNQIAEVYCLQPAPVEPTRTPTVASSGPSKQPGIRHNPEDPEDVGGSSAKTRPRNATRKD